jgi:hypothetical protein
VKVTTIIAHDSADKQTHRPGHTYELAGIELELRLKDGIVREATAAPVPEPSVAATIAAVHATVKDEVDATRDLPPSDPEE